MIKHILASIIAVSLALSSCTVFQNPGLTATVVAGVTSVGLARLPADMQSKVAVHILTASSLYTALAGPDGIPSVAQFNDALVKYLPNDTSKPYAMSALNLIYASYYQWIADHSPKDQLAYLGVLMNGFAMGAAPYAH